MAHISEYEVETKFIDRLESIGYQYVDLKSYADVLANARTQIATFNAAKLTEAKGEPCFSDAEWNRVLTHLDNHTVYESAKVLRDKQLLVLDNEKSVYLDFFSVDTDRNVCQVAHQITMDPDHKDDVSYKNRYDVTVLINGLPLVQVELKRPGVEINEAINQINRYRKFSFRGLFRFIQIFVVSNSVQTKYFCNENEMDGGVYSPILKSLVFFWTDATNRRINTLEEFTSEFFRKAALAEMIGKFMVVKATEPVLMAMRPYQIFAVKAARKRVLEANQSGYVFACTGSGKTLTSFKLAQLLRDEPRIDKVVFLVDRKDLDDQAVDEYNSFEKDCVDSSGSTGVLAKQLQDAGRKLIVTTIQKMANAVKTRRYGRLMDALRDSRVIFIIDECHRSQFGRMHADISRHFRNANYIGFTGTPIFEQNKGPDGRTTADVFSAGLMPDGSRRNSCLHTYMIKDAIADGNVLRFSVEYQRTLFIRAARKDGADAADAPVDDPEWCSQHGIDIDSLYHDEARIRMVAESILKQHARHVHPQGRDVYTSLFAVDSIRTLGRYYDAFKELNETRPEAQRYRIAAIFTCGANEDIDGRGDEHSAELLARCIKDYNGMFGTAYTPEIFDSYRKDISRRLKQKNLPQVDILLVVNMMLTGFDAKPLNTLYLDKNLAWHTLVQAYSRTNRVDKSTKLFGQVVTFRNIKRCQDEALRLFSGDGDPNAYLVENYDFHVRKWLEAAPLLRKIAPTVDAAGQLKSEDAIRMFVIAFRSLARTLAVLKTFSQFDWADLAVELGEEEYEGYKSWYLYFRDQAVNPGGGGGEDDPPPVPVDVDFDVELVRTDRINVVYILNLLKAAGKAGKTQEERDADLDLILREIERSDNESLRAKKDLMAEFVNERFYGLPADADVEASFEEFMKEREKEETEDFARLNGIEPAVLNGIMTEYIFSGGITEEAIRRLLEPFRLGLLRLTKLTEDIKDFVVKTYRKYRAEGD